MLKSVLIRSEVVSLVLGDTVAINKEFTQLHSSITSVLRPVISQAQKYLLKLQGTAFNSIEGNKKLANDIHALVSRLGCRIRCPRADCSETVTIDYQLAAGTKYGKFRFKHQTGSKIDFTSRQLPELRLVIGSSPLRRKRG